ncbi:lytic transglycosylase domain-containing protein [Pseudoxanthomonas gei]
MELMSCPDLAVPLAVMQHVVRVESSHNPFAIGVVGGHLVRQPKNLPEALSTVRMLESRGFNFSLGIAQVNRYNLGKFGLDSYEKAFQLCPNLQAGSRILAECYGRSGRDWGKSFSCYYSGNFVTGYRHGYVQKIYASMRQVAPGAASAPQGDAIAVVSRPSRRTVGISRYPVYAPPRQDATQVSTQPAPPSGLQLAAPQSLGNAPGSAPDSMSAGPTPALLQPTVLTQQYPPGTASVAGQSPTPAPALPETSIDSAFVF